MAYPRLLRNIIIVAIALGLTACGTDEGFVEGQVPVPTAFVRVLNAIPDSPTLSVQIDNRSQTTLAYNGGSGFIPLIPGIARTFEIAFIDDNQVQTLLSRELIIEADANTSLILTGTMDNPVVIELPGSTEAFTDTDTFSEVTFVHAATSNPETVSFMLVRDGDFAGAVSTTLAQFTESLTLQPTAAPGIELYAVTVLPASGVAPAADTILWRSGSFELLPRTRALLVLTDYFGPAGAGVRILNVGSGAATTFTTEDLPAALRVANLAPEQDAVDIYVNDIQIVSGANFAEVTDYALTFESGTIALKVTPSGDPDTVLLENTSLLLRGSFQTLVLSGLVSAETFGFGLSRDENRTVPTQLQFSGVNGAPNAGALDYYLLEPGTTVANGNPILLTNNLLTIATISPEAGDYEFSITSAGTKTVLYGPEAFTLSNGSTYRFYVTDVPGDDTQVQVILEDDFLP